MRTKGNEQQSDQVESASVIAQMSANASREQCKHYALDIHLLAPKMDDKYVQELEAMVNKVGRDADNQKDILNVQSGKALSMFDPAAWPCCHTDFFYGDCIPFDNTRPTFIAAHDVFRILLNREESEYSLPQDEASELRHGKVYKALTTSRWDSPEMVAVPTL